MSTLPPRYRLLVRVAGSVEIERPASQVWGYVADYGNDPSWRAAVTQMRQSHRGGSAAPGGRCPAPVVGTA